MLRRLMHLATKRLHRPVIQAAEFQAPGTSSTLDSAKQESVAVPGTSSTLDSAKQESVAVVPDEEYFSFEIDWSVFSIEYLRLTFQELLFSLLGIPMPGERQCITVQNGYRHSNLRMSELYRQQLLVGGENGFLVRGVIFDMAAISVPHQPKEEGSGSKDWSNLIYENLNLSQSKAGKVDDVSAEQVMENLGLKNSEVLKQRLVRPNSTSARKKQLAEKQKLEEVLGTGDSIRAKYADKIRQKKVLAEARREQGKLGVFVTASPGNKPGDSTVMPGSASLVRYLEERGVAQALLTRGPDEDVRTLMDQLGNFQFRDVRRLDDSSGEFLTEGMIRSLCTKWGLPSKQVLVVVGANSKSEQLLRTVADKGYFVCRVQETSLSTESGSNQLLGSRKHASGLSTWFTQLAEGTLHMEDKKQNLNKKHVHFHVLDMTELKWVIEDLNGVSYRSSTVVRGFK